jgi:hypothetical protein
MTWLGLAILTAFFESLKDVFSKKSLIFLDEYVWLAQGWRSRQFLCCPF